MTSCGTKMKFLYQIFIDPNQYVVKSLNTQNLQKCNDNLN